MVCLALAFVWAVLAVPAIALAGKPDKPPGKDKDGGDAGKTPACVEFWDFPDDGVFSDGAGSYCDSKKLKVGYLQTKTTVEIKYTAPYANLVHFGGMVRPYGATGRTLKPLPPRPWISAVLNGGWGIEKLDVDSIINEALLEAWNEAFGG